MKTLIAWQPEADKPDDTTTVLVGFRDGDCETGYWDSELACWRNFAGDRFDEGLVVGWAPLPEVPAELLAQKEAA